MTTHQPEGISPQETMDIGSQEDTEIFNFLSKERVKGRPLFTLDQIAPPMLISEEN